MKKLIRNCLSALLCFGCLSSVLAANDCIGDYAKDVPGIGLVSDSIKFDGITLSEFYFENDKKYVFVEPEEEFSIRMHYKIDADKLETLDRHHLIIGLHNDGPQKCILHAYGIKDSEGDACVTLKAPKSQGVYEVRFCHGQGWTEKEAKKAWWQGKGPSASTIMGIVVVK